MLYTVRLFTDETAEEEKKEEDESLFFSGQYS